MTHILENALNPDEKKIFYDSRDIVFVICSGKNFVNYFRLDLLLILANPKKNGQHDDVLWHVDFFGNVFIYVYRRTGSLGLCSLVSCTVYLLRLSFQLLGHMEN